MSESTELPEPTLTLAEQLLSAGIDVTKPLERRETKASGYVVSSHGLPYHLLESHNKKLWDLVQKWISAAESGNLESGLSAPVFLDYVAAPEETPKQKADALAGAATNAVEEHINVVLASRSYKADGATLTNYIKTDEEIAEMPEVLQPRHLLFREEAKKARDWITNCWAIMAAIQAGDLAQPATLEDLITSLPPMEWPEGSTPRGA